MKNKNKEDKFFQNILICLSDGREIMASVPAFAEKQEDIEEVVISKVFISPPKKLPGGMSFSSRENL